ncbi:adenosine deaminase [Robertkochia marina]|uniref:Adenosine deaminase n=1 Tax=Robertkochia marina TaxID=1227945 RepID=A0A4S3M077_9FLAO|nr:class I SAM-dependent methyltransferase [Robertkochia marina]THD67568.1 adenosine deaminase [Robertkochia marina]TRZ44564.1 adenosine deaminase [Robertkochia marina]
MEVHETAFVTSAFRAMHVLLSKDEFAHLWLNDRVQHWADTYLSTVTGEESAAHSMRNRYFLDSIHRLFKDGNIEYLINFGCGFSMYPYLLPHGLKHIEIDKPEVIRHKDQKTELWEDQGILPLRNIVRIPCDFSENYEKELIGKINDIKKNSPCFILLEGVLFFLTREEMLRLFQLFNTLQKQGDRIGSVSFRAKDTESKAFALLLDFMKKENPHGTEEARYQTVEEKFYKSLPGYELVDQQDFFSLSKSYQHQPSATQDMIINEQFYQLQKTRP